MKRFSIFKINMQAEILVQESRLKKAPLHCIIIYKVFAICMYIFYSIYTSTENQRLINLLLKGKPKYYKSKQILLYVCL